MSFLFTVNGKDYSDWTTASLTRSIEQPAASFSFSAPNPQKQVEVKAQDEIEISIDNNVETKGKIFKITGSGDGQDSVRGFAGRSTIADAIDSSAPLQPGLWENVSAKNIIEQLLKPYQITAEFLVETQGETQLRSNPGDAVWALIDKLLKKENLFAYELKPGILTVTRAPESGSVASLEFGTQDIRVISGYSLDITNRYSSYTVIGEGILGQPPVATGIAYDPNIKNRPLIIQLTGNVDSARCQQVADYEAAVRAARSLSFSYIVPNWYSNQGELWKPNQRVNIIDNENDINGEHLMTATTLTEDGEDEWAVLKFAPPESYTLKPPQPPASDNLFST